MIALLKVRLYIQVFNYGPRSIMFIYNLEEKLMLIPFTLCSMTC